MIICTKCHQAMTCIQTGTNVHYGQGHMRSGDTYQCRKCGMKVISDLSDAWYAKRQPAKDVFSFDMDEDKYPGNRETIQQKVQG